MKKKQLNFWQITTIVTFIGAIVLTFIAKKNYEKFEKLRLDYITCEHNVSRFNYRFYREVSTENKVMENIKLVGVDNTIIRICEIIKAKTLVYRFSNRSCSPCVENDIMELKKLGSTIGYDNIIIISDYDNTRSLINLISKFSMSFKCYNYKNNIELAIDQESSMKEAPFFLVINRDLEINFAHLSHEDDKINEIYFNRVKEFMLNE